MSEKLKEIREALYEAMPLIEIHAEAIKTNSGGKVSISNLINLRKGIELLDNFKLFVEIIDTLKSSVIFKNNDDNVVVTPSDSIHISGEIEVLFILTKNLYRTIIEIMPIEDINSVNIRFPDLDDFDDLSKYSKQFHYALTQVLLLPDIGATTEIKTVSPGSIWVNVLIGSSLGLGVVASLTWAAYVIMKKRQEVKMFEEHYRTLEIKNNGLKDVQEAQKKLIDLAIEAEARYISSEHFKTNEPENIERIKNSVSTLAELLQKGAEIHPSLVAPEQVTNLFPNPTKLIGLESRIKKIENE